MKIEYHNLYTYFILITQNRTAFITRKEPGQDRKIYYWRN